MRTKGLDARLAAARAGGFDSMSVFPIDYTNWRATLPAAAIRRRFEDAGILAAIVDPFVQWVPRFAIPAGYPEANVSFIQYSADQVLAIAAELGATQVNLVEGLGQAYPRAELVDALGAFVERAAANGLACTLEPMPISSIVTLADGWDLVRQVDHPSLGLTLDTWHFWRASPDHELLATIPGDKITEVQLADGQTALHGDLLNDLLHHRLLPGEGDFELRTTVAVLQQIGAMRRVGPELFSDAMDALEATEVGRRAGENLTAWTK